MAPLLLHSQAVASRHLASAPHIASCRWYRAHALRTTQVQADRRAFVLGSALSPMGLAIAAASVGALGLAAAARAGASTTSGRGDSNALTREGMDKFRQNRVEESLVDFDSALAVAPRIRPYLWQRGLSLYYVERFDEGAQQFRDDVAVNPNDTEEAIWAFLCEARTLGVEVARQRFLKVGRDPRPVMRAACECFETGEPPERILAASSDDGGHDTFYAQLYVGLWHEAHGDTAAARAGLTAAVATPYARQSGDYMASLANVHCQRRGWAAA